jgi:hypothetical protein
MPTALKSAGALLPSPRGHRYGRNVSSWSTGAVGDEVGELATGQGEDFLQVLSTGAC